MNLDFSKIAPFLSHPLVLVGFVLCMLFLLFIALVKAKSIPTVTKEAGAGILHVILNYGFLITLITLLLVFIYLKTYYTHVENYDKAIQATYEDEKTQPDKKELSQNEPMFKIIFSANSCPRIENNILIFKITKMNNSLSDVTLDDLHTKYNVITNNPSRHEKMIFENLIRNNSTIYNEKSSTMEINIFPLNGAELKNNVLTWR